MAEEAFRGCEGVVEVWDCSVGEDRDFGEDPELGLAMGRW